MQDRSSCEMKPKRVSFSVSFFSWHLTFFDCWLSLVSNFNPEDRFVTLKKLFQYQEILCFEQLWHNENACAVSLLVEFMYHVVNVDRVRQSVSLVNVLFLFMPNRCNGQWMYRDFSSFWLSLDWCILWPHCSGLLMKLVRMFWIFLCYFVSSNEWLHQLLVLLAS